MTAEVTEPLAGQFGPSHVTDLLTGLGFTAHASRDGRMPLRPAKVVVVAPTGGPGFSVEQSFDARSFQIRCRGPQGDPGDIVEAMAWAVDYALVPPPMATPLTPFRIGNQFVNLVTRVGGPPAFLIRDKSRSVHYTCNYIFNAARA